MVSFIHLRFILRWPIGIAFCWAVDACPVGDAFSLILAVFRVGSKDTVTHHFGDAFNDKLIERVFFFAREGSMPFLGLMDQPIRVLRDNIDGLVGGVYKSRHTHTHIHK